LRPQFIRRIFMKKYCYFPALLLALLLLAGCGTSGSTQTADAAAADTYTEAAVAEEAAYDTAEAATTESEAQAQDADGLVLGQDSQDLSEKIIYSAYAELETTDFEASISAVEKLQAQYGAFVESSSITGTDLSDSYYGITSRRSATYTLRVPKENYFSLTDGLSSVGNVTYLSSDATNITQQYTDTASRLSAYETEEARLLEILAEAETVEDMISVENRLSEIRYQKESLTSQLQNWDNQVSYSSVTIVLSEVQELTPEPTEEPSYWQEVVAAFRSTLHGLFVIGKTLLKLLIAATPVLVPILLVIAVILVVHRRKKKHHKQESPKEHEE
jgi:predicted small lipoprotein YifL